MQVTPTWDELLGDAGARLQVAGVEQPHRDARLLAAHVMGVAPLEVLARTREAPDHLSAAAFEIAITRRISGEPVSRIRGWREFYGRRFIVTPDVLDPRPETELLVDESLRRWPTGGRVLDLGVGSGCILLSILFERADATGVGVDVSDAALGVARQNAELLGVARRAELVRGGWDHGEDRCFDFVLSNPPYIARAELPGLAREVGFDPELSLTPGDDPLSAYREIVAVAPHRLLPGGWIGLEVGAGQAGAVAGLLRARGFGRIETFPDLAGVERAVFACATF